MQLLEPVPQDIKGARDYKPCAPEVFRWIVVAGYAVVLLSALLWGLFLLRDKQQNSLAEKDQQRMKEVDNKLAEIREKGAQSKEIKGRYDEWQKWLKGNYTLSKFLAQIYRALPEGSRLQELTLNEKQGRPGSFSMKLRFFSQGENRVVNTQDFEDKLIAMGVQMQDRQQSVAEGGKTEIISTITLPHAFYPKNGGPSMVDSMPGMMGDPAGISAMPLSSGNLFESTHKGGER